jgi:lipid-A-disaccharide synthase-like uncharacterized protein
MCPIQFIITNTDVITSTLIAYMNHQRICDQMALECKLKYRKSTFCVELIFSKRWFVFYMRVEKILYTRSFHSLFFDLLGMNFVSFLIQMSDQVAEAVRSLL